MGYGEWVGNQSVHWTIVHEDGDGRPVRLAVQDGRGDHPRTGNEVHVDRSCRGRDPVSLESVGERKGHAGRYRVVLRYERMEDAQAAAASAQRIEARGGLYELVIDVPVIRRTDPDDPPAPEVRIDW